MDTIPQSDQPMADAPVAARDSAMSNSAQGGQRGTVPLPPGIRQPKRQYVATYTKQYQLRIFNELAAYTTPTYEGIQYNSFIPPFHDIPCDLLAFYLNYSEMQRLRNKTSVQGLEFNVSVANHTAIITYETNASGTQIGNNNLGVTMCVLDPALHKYRTGVAVEAQQGDLVNRICWGTNANALVPSATPSTALQGLSAQYITRNFTNKYCYLTPRAAPTRTHNGLTQTVIPMQFFNINRFISKRVNVSMEEGVIATWSHKPKHGHYFGRYANLYGRGGIQASNFVSGQKPLAMRPLITGTTNMQNQVAGAAPTSTFNVIGNMYNDIWENETNLTRINIENHFAGDTQTIDHPDVLTLGIEPQIAINNGVDQPVAIPLHVDLIVTAMCKLLITEGTDYCEANYGTQEEYEFKFPQYRVYRADNISGEPSIIQPTMHTELPVDADIGFNSTSINRTLPTTWAWPSAVGATRAEDDKTLHANLKSIEKDLGEYLPYMTRAMKKKHDEKEKDKTQSDQPSNKIVKKAAAVFVDSEEENLN
jgi:hypothetical protein